MKRVHEWFIQNKINNTQLKLYMAIHFVYNFKLLIYCIKSRDLLSYRIQHTVIFQLSVLIYVSKEKTC